jgi:hypothetical protein
MPVKNRARHSGLADNRERLAGAFMWRMYYQRQVSLDRCARESCEHQLRRVEHRGVPCPIAVPWQADFANRTNRRAFAGDQFERLARVIFAMFKSFGMKS